MNQLRPKFGSVARGLVKGATVAVTAMGVVLAMAVPAGATPDLSIQAFQIHPPNYCAMSAGSWFDAGYPTLSISSATYSRTSAGGLCQYPSPALYNVLAAYPKLEYFSGGSTWFICDLGTHRVNASGDADVFASDTVYACGHFSHRLRSEHRVTYAGVNTYKTRYSGSYIP